MARTEGSQVYEAMLTDERLTPSHRKQLNRDNTPYRPPLAGYSREVQELHKVHVTLTHLLRATTRNYGIEIPSGPLLPGESIRAEIAREELAELDSDIAASMTITIRKETNART